MYHDSTEVDEQKYPIHVWEKRLIPDSEGAGRQRGALGSKVVYGCKNEPMTVAYTFEGHENPARGVRGGLDGAPSNGWKIEPDGRREELPMATTLAIVPGERLVSLTGGGGGYASPLERDPAAVCHDVMEGWVSPERARSVYGVVLNELAEERDVLIVDEDATRELRAQLSTGSSR
jgi:N-methylhydantoinase B